MRKKTKCSCQDSTVDMGTGRKPECPYDTQTKLWIRPWTESQNALTMPGQCFGYGHEQNVRMPLRYPDGDLDMTMNRKSHLGHADGDLNSVMSKVMVMDRTRR